MSNLFEDVQSNPTEIYFHTNRENFTYGKIYLVYKDFKGVLTGFIPQAEPLLIPKDLEVKVVAFTVIEGKPYFHESSLIPRQDIMEVELIFKPIPKSRLKQIIYQF